jgi:hypothetical protein
MQEEQGNNITRGAQLQLHGESGEDDEQEEEEEELIQFNLVDGDCAFEYKIEKGSRNGNDLPRATMEKNRREALPLSTKRK